MENNNNNNNNNKQKNDDDLKDILDNIPEISFDDIQQLDYRQDLDSFKEVKLKTGLSGLKYLFTSSGKIITY